MRGLIFVLTLSLSGAVAAAEPALLVHAGSLLAVPGEAPLPEQTIVIRGSVIEAVRPGYLTVDEVEGANALLDLRDRFVLPGLMDMHVHLLTEIGPDARLRQLTEGDAMTLMRGVANARKTLLAGFTTVRDLGSKPESIYALRDAAAAGLIDAPRIFAAGSPLAATGGHGDVDGMRADLMAMWTPETICDGAVDCRRATRHAVKYGADWIKITATGGVLSDAATGLEQQMTDEELAEIVATAHALGRKVAAHAHGVGGIDAALRAGVDTIDHGTFVADSSIKLFRRSGAYLVPTLMPGHFVPLSMENNPFFTDAIKAKARRAAQAAKENFRHAYESGVKIAFGTDSAVTPHGMNAREFELMVAAGMPEAEAIRSATVVPAEILGIDDQAGSIVAGKTADIIAVEGNPLADVTRLQAVSHVIRAGRLIR